MAFIGLGIIDIMNIVLFCRILYVDFETLQHESLENRNTLSKDKDKCEDNLVYNNDVIEESVQDFPVENSLCVESLGNTINQNTSNGCHQRIQRTELDEIDKRD